jgi:L-alanine-DL-glutamate epimerase-like enolase superfamily enzyme
LTRTITSPIELSFEELDLELTNPFGISRGTRSTAQNLVVLLSHGGLIGLGEAAPTASRGESQKTAKAFLTAVQESKALGKDPFAVDEIMQGLDRLAAGHDSVKAAIDMALWDLIGKVTGLPLYRHLGLSGASKATNDMTIGIDTVAEMVRKAREAVMAGFKILKIKLGTDYDQEIILAIRREIGSDVVFRVDPNCAWTPKHAIKMSHFLADQNVQLIEQPIPKDSPLADYELVRRNSSLPIFADESIARAPDAVRLASGIDGIVVKLAKSGGIRNAIQLIHTAEALNLQVMFGCMVESSLGITAACQIASLVDFLDLDGALLLAEDPFEGVVWKDQLMQLPDRPGLGVVFRE